WFESTASIALRKEMIGRWKVQMITSEGGTSLHSYRVALGQRKLSVDSLLYELIDIITTKIYTVNRRLSGSVEISEHDTRKDEILERAGVAEGIIHKLISKVAIFSQECYAVCTVIKDETAARFTSICLDEGKNPHVPFPYTLQLREVNADEISISILYDMNENVSWMEKCLIPSIIRWIDNIVNGTFDKNRVRLCEGTNSLIGVEEYTRNYREIKDQFGREVAKNWIDKTSAEKFVFEDCGIATYLSVLWTSRNVRPKRFVDVGCGNGLLVHLLNNLGYSGCGVDLRERKTWKGMFPQDELVECALDPSSSMSGLPEGGDFLIGNHSDELTPWIPVMAARSCLPFFLLPCCPFDFYGKLPRKGTASLYEELILYVKKISERLGYTVEIDKLAIPSTKRTALVCTVPPNGLREDLEEEIDRLLEESKKGRVFIARAKQEKVRNCSGMGKEAREALIERIVKRLMEGEEKGEEWRKGQTLTLPQIVSLLSPHEKKMMKEQCGGVQTFLKNQHQIFKVVSGTVSLRDWREETRCAPEGRLRKSLCWFHANHPDGCPMNDKCTFSHSPVM
ncbi:hypothetical protein PMAYCL1PPCAC_12362, partial [Pristionchus mayeri]